MLSRFRTSKEKSKSWEEVREEIIEAVEEEKRRQEPLVSVSASGAYPHSEPGKIHSTSAEDSYTLEEEEEE